jgi:hypothetical protein
MTNLLGGRSCKDEIGCAEIRAVSRIGCGHKSVKLPEVRVVNVEPVAEVDLAVGKLWV